VAAGTRAGEPDLYLRVQHPVAVAPVSALTVDSYTVQDGDSLWAIADSFDTDAATLEALNAGVDAYALQPGQSLKVIRAFHGMTYTVQSGDTLPDVADRYGVDTDEIRKANGLQLTAGLREGETLFLPGARPSTRNMLASRGTVNRSETPPAVKSETQATVAVAPKPAPAAAAPPNPAPAAKPAAKTGAKWMWPISGGMISSEFGYREDIGDFHEGLDIAVPRGTIAVAARGGVVVESGWDAGYGYCVIIDHGDGYKTRYAHASAVLVSVGETVAQGDPVIRVGSTGHATGDHLHFEVIVNGTPENPRDFLP
jgi:murein DD-endopeptidase MepM/ murein hydrolase activator NlpD